MILGDGKSYQATSGVKLVLWCFVKMCLIEINKAPIILIVIRATNAEIFSVSILAQI